MIRAFTSMTFKSILKEWNQFWFEAGSFYSLGLARLVLGGNLFLLYLKRHVDVSKFYTDSGFLKQDLAFEIMPDFYRPLLNWGFWPDSWNPQAHALFLVLLFFVFLGLGNRFLLFLTWVLHIFFIQRNYSVIFGADLIGGIFLFYLSFTQCYERFSAARWLSTYFGILKKQKSEKPDLISSVFVRLFQIQLCVIYFYTGLEKLKGNTWWDGTALWSVLANPQMVLWDMTWTRHIPLFIVGVTYSTVLFEILFPILIWTKRFRVFLLSFGFVFHAGIGILMALYPFAIVMLIPYLFFFTEEEVRSFFDRKWLKQAKR